MLDTSATHSPAHGVTTSAHDTAQEAAAALCARGFTGRTLTAEDEHYDRERALWNADCDGRPLLLAQCLSTSDVSCAVAFAVDHGLEIAVRGGGHSLSGASTTDGGIVIDLSRMRTATLDPLTEHVHVQGGCLLSDMDRATEPAGRAASAGLIGHTGVGGLVLGGGMGWLTRKAGLSVDNLVSAEVVLADGRVVRTDATTEPDLFWALRGGGGNFGVVTELELATVEVGQQVDLGLFFWRPEQAQEALALVRAVAEDLDPDLQVMVIAMNLPEVPVVPTEHHGAPGYAFFLVGFGAEQAHARVVARVREDLPPVFDFVGRVPWLALQSMFDDVHPHGRFNYEKTVYLGDLGPDEARTIAAGMEQKQAEISEVLFYRLDGRFCDVAEDATAFGGRRVPQWSVFIVGKSLTKDGLVPERTWVRGLYESLQPFSLIGEGGYVNSMSVDDRGRTRAAYGDEKYARLQRIKSAYDPGNVFHRNMNIAPD